jgi:hypothetical protein
MTIRYWNENSIWIRANSSKHSTFIMSSYDHQILKSKVNIWIRTNSSNHSIFVMFSHHDQILKWRVNIWTRTNFSKYSIFEISLHDRQILKWRVNIWIITNSSKHSIFCNVFTLWSDIEKQSECLNKNNCVKHSICVMSSYDDMLMKWKVDI